jgi:VanZ family protein
MRTLILAITLLCTNVKAQSLNEVLSLHQDKQLHVGYTYIISSVTASYVLKKTNNKKKAIFIGIGVGMTIGIAKEVYDARNGGAQGSDLIADLVGATCGSLVITIPF